MSCAKIVLRRVPKGKGENNSVWCMCVHYMSRACTRLRLSLRLPCTESEPSPAVLTAASQQGCHWGRHMLQSGGFLADSRNSRCGSENKAVIFPSIVPGSGFLPPSTMGERHVFPSDTLSSGNARGFWTESSVESVQVTPSRAGAPKALRWARPASVSPPVVA